MTHTTKLHEAEINIIQGALSSKLALDPVSSQPKNQIMSQTKYCIDFQNVKEAASRIEGIAHRTPVLTSETIIPNTGKKYFFKVEAMQKTGSFKFRGALNAVKAELEQKSASKRGIMPVVTHSSGVGLLLFASSWRLVGSSFSSSPF